MRREWPVLLILLLAAVSGWNAQVDTGVLTVLVTDSTGAVVPGAKITIVGEGASLRYVVESNATGLFVSPGLRKRAGGHHRQRRESRAPSPARPEADVLKG